MKRMSPARAIAYGLPGLATLFTFTMFTTYGLYFFTNVVGLSGSFAGLIMTIGTLWDAVTDPLVGILSDNRDPKKGRRRPFLLTCAVPFGVVTWLLFTTWDFVESRQKIYFIVVALLFYTFQTLIDVPYTSLSGEVTDDYDLRSKLATIRTFWAIIGVAIGGGIMTYTAFLEPVVGGMRQAWSVCFALFGFICTISILIGYKASEGYENQNISVKKSYSVKEMIEGPFRNKPFLHLTIAFIFGTGNFPRSPGILFNLQLKFKRHTSVSREYHYVDRRIVLGVSDRSLVHKIFKSDLMDYFNGNLAALYDHLPIIFPETRIYNCTDHYDQYSCRRFKRTVSGDLFYDLRLRRGGERREGLFYSMATVSQKIAAAIGVSILGMVIDYVGYDPLASVQSISTLEGFQNIFVIGTSVCLLLSIITMATNPLTKKRYSEVLQALQLKRTGQNISLDEFKDLLFLKKRSI